MAASETKNLTERKIMKLKMIVVFSVAAVALVVVGTACSPSKESAPASGQKILYYTCPMHPSVKADKAGDCPKCGMALQPVYGAATDTNAPPASTNPPSAM